MGSHARYYRSLGKSTWWLYLLTESDTGEVRYVGITTDPPRRARDHRGSSFGRSLRARGAVAAMLVLRPVAGATEARRQERVEIVARRSLGTSLMNRTAIVDLIRMDRRASCPEVTDALIALRTSQARFCDPFGDPCPL